MWGAAVARIAVAVIRIAAPVVRIAAAVIRIEPLCYNVTKKLFPHD